jgi:hypothetical protein
LRAFVGTIGEREDKQRALRDIRACALGHLGKVLAPSWSLRGLWHWLLSQIVVRRMDFMLDRLNTEPGPNGGLPEKSTNVASRRTQRLQP